MLAAVLYGKAGRVQLDNHDEKVNWRRLFNRNEDLLTAVFFSRVNFLSTKLQKELLDCLLGQSTVEFGNICSIQFWPSFHASKLSHGNTHRVEPDIIIKCENGWVVIELKPPFGGVQRKEQWQNELLALVEEAGRVNSEFEIPDKIGFVALGNNSDDCTLSACSDIDTNGLFTISANKIEWEEIFKFLDNLPKTETPADKQVLDDWHNAFSLFGIVRKPQPLSQYLSMSQALCENDLETMRSLKSSRLSVSARILCCWQPLVELGNHISTKDGTWTFHRTS